MGLGPVSSSLLLHLLLVMCAYGGESRTMMNMQSMDHVHPLTSTSSAASHMNHMNPSEMIFFTPKDLYAGKTMAVYFRRKNLSTSPRFLPRDEADSIPFASNHLPDLLKFFSISPDSSQAKAMEHTLNHCETKPIRGETKFCTTSLESMLDFARGVFGLDSPFSVVTTEWLGNSDVSFQNYTILEVPKEIMAEKKVACHSLPYPYAVFYCHSQKSENKVYKVSLRGENGESVEAIAVCHMDTSQWNRDHASFRVLGIEPGTSPVCHFFPADNLVWVPAASV